MQYEIIIGLEVHVELSTNTKIFCGCANTFGAPPNTLVCPVCLGMPGSLPVLNKKAVEYAVLAGLALGCEINTETVFDRKNYFYPDLPKAYQISQLYFPICRNGKLKEIRIHEIHLEEDAGKLLHDPWEDKSNIDYNRCGTPLIEIVTEPDFRSAGEVTAFLESLREILVYLGVSDCKMQEGSMRADINLSVRPAGSKELGTRTEMKNMNSLKAIYRAVEFEGKRQIEAIERGEEITQQTRRWDENKDASFPMRDKENAQDYRYFPDPDLMALKISEDWINRIKNTMPESAAKKRERFINDFMLTAYDANVLTSEKPLCELFEKVNELCENPREAANLINVEVIRLMKEFAVSAEEAVKKLKPEHLAALIKKIAEGSINRTVGKDVLKEIFIEGVSPDEYIKHKNLSVIEDASIIDIAVRLVITENEKSVADYISGKEKAFSYLVGQAMKQLKGRANPALVNTALRERLNEL